MPDVEIPRARYMTLMRLCTRTTSRTSIEWTRANSRSRLNLRGALSTGVMTSIRAQVLGPHGGVQDVALLAAALTDSGDHDLVHVGDEDLVEPGASSVPALRQRCFCPASPFR